jgi:hypothetical protein
MWGGNLQGTAMRPDNSYTGCTKSLCNSEEYYSEEYYRIRFQERFGPHHIVDFADVSVAVREHSWPQASHAIVLALTIQLHCISADPLSD